MANQAIQVEQLDDILSKVAVTSLDLSFNELADMHSTGELNILPEFQRMFRWSVEAQSRFIETLVLGLPIPPIYVVEEEAGTYVLIDGLQRISTYLHFRGLLDAPAYDPPIKKGDYLELFDCDIIDALNGLTFEDLSTALKIKLKRAFVRVEVIKRASDKRFKYHMFKRLNTGGVVLSEQQIRNCTIRMLDATFNDFIMNLAREQDYKTCVSNLTNEQRDNWFDQELVLRFFAFKNYSDAYKHEVSEFLTTYMERVSDPDDELTFDYEAEKAVFSKTFQLLNGTWGGRVFARPKPSDENDLSQSFAVYHYESLTLGIQPVLDRIDADKPEHVARLKQAILQIKQAPQFVTLTTGGGKNSPGQMKARIDFVTNSLLEAFPNGL